MAPSECISSVSKSGLPKGFIPACETIHYCLQLIYYEELAHDILFALIIKVIIAVEDYTSRM